MGKIPSKGSQLMQDLSGVFVAVAQLTSLGHQGAETEKFETDGLDNEGPVIELSPTGRTSGGSVDAQMLYDPLLGSHQLITGLLQNPTQESWVVVHTAGATILAFTSAAISFEWTAAQGDFWRGSFSAAVTAFTYG